MSRSTKLSLVAAFVSILKANESMDELFVRNAGPVLLALCEDNTEDNAGVAEIKAEWRKLNVAAYAKLRLRKGSTGYALVSKRSSMLLAIALKDVDVLAGMVKKYVSLQGVYSTLNKGHKVAKAAAKRPLTFREKLVKFLSNATSAQRKMVQSNIRSILAAAAE